MPEAWEERITAIASSLLALEINTIEATNMSASKMPDLPLALHQIAQLYKDDLEKRGINISDELLDAAQARIDGGNDPAPLARLEGWNFDPKLNPPSSKLTNGAKTFEALGWAADAARKRLENTLLQGGGPQTVVAGVDSTLLLRMLISSRELRQVTLLLLEQHKGIDPAGDLFGGTVEATTAVLFKQPRPRLTIDADVLVLVRKIWDIGLERVLFQTTMQVDGDVLVRAAPDLSAEKREFYSELHRSTSSTALAQWHSLFQLAGTLVSGLGSLLFGRK